MKKRKGNVRDGNVIQFPDLEKRLLDKGEEFLQQEKYHDALDVFQEVVKLEPSNSDGYLGLILSYVGTGSFDEAIELARMMLQEDMGDYFSMMDLYLKLLYEAHRYDEIVTVIEGLLEERAIPSDKLEHYYSILNLARNSVQEKEKEPEMPVSMEEFEQGLRLYDYHDQQEQVMLAAKLAYINIQPYKKEIISYLRDAKGDFFFKTLLLNVLKEHQVEQAVEIHKFNQMMPVIPKELVDVKEISQLQQIIALIAQRIEHDDPVLFDSIKMLIHRQFFLFYPFPLTGHEISVWAAAYHALGLEYFGNVYIKRGVLEDYDVQEDEFAEADSFIRMIEEISSPNI